MTFSAFGNFFRLASRPLLALKKLSVKIFVLPVYGLYVRLANRINKRTPLFKEQLLLFLTNKYLVHILIVLIAIGVTTSNVLAYEKREDYGQNALIYKIVGINGDEIILETNTVADGPQVYSYQENNLALERGHAIETDQSDANTDSDNVFTDYLQNDLALAKPQLIGTSDAVTGKKAIREYEVAEGDSLGKLAAKFNISINTILWANNLSLNSFIRPGQKLVILPVSGVRHIVIKGDTLAKIAKKYDASEDKISEYNSLEDEAVLAVGESLIIPDGRIIYTAKPSVYANAVPGKKGTGSNTAISATGRMVWPSACRRISQYYKGWRHTGVDIACPWGTAIRAADGGRIVRVQYLRYGYGYNVIIDHGGGKQTLYGHMSQIDVDEGQYVGQGQVIGKEGSTGRSTGPHLHFEVRVGGTQVNPLSYIR